MVKKKRRAFNARLKEETFSTIQGLAERWRCSQTEVIERLVDGYRVPGREAPVVVSKSEQAREELMEGIKDMPEEYPKFPEEEVHELKIEYEAE